MWTFIAFISTNFVWFFIGFFTGIYIDRKMKEDEKEKKEDTDEVQSTES